MLLWWRKNYFLKKISPKLKIKYFDEKNFGDENVCFWKNISIAWLRCREYNTILNMVTGGLSNGQF
jgi:hypothetical protein